MCVIGDSILSTILKGERGWSGIDEKAKMANVGCCYLEREKEERSYGVETLTII